MLTGHGRATAANKVLLRLGKLSLQCNNGEILVFEHLSMVIRTFSIFTVFGDASTTPPIYKGRKLPPRIYKFHGGRQFAWPVHRCSGLSADGGKVSDVPRPARPAGSALPLQPPS